MSVWDATVTVAAGAVVVRLKDVHSWHSLIEGADYRHRSFMDVVGEGKPQDSPASSGVDFDVHSHRLRPIVTESIGCFPRHLRRLRRTP